MAKGTFLAHNVAWAVLGEKMNHRSQASANSNSGAWPFSATAPSNYVTAITSAKEKPPSHPSGGGALFGCSCGDAGQATPTGHSAATVGVHACCGLGFAGVSGGWSSGRNSRILNIQSLDL